MDQSCVYINMASVERSFGPLSGSPMPPAFSASRWLCGRGVVMSILTLQAFRRRHVSVSATTKCGPKPNNMTSASVHAKPVCMHIPLHMRCIVLKD